MASIRVQHMIPAPAEKIFEVLANPLNDPRWIEDVLTCTLDSGTPGTVGSKYKQRARTPQGEVDTTITIEQLTPSSRIQSVLEGGPMKVKNVTTLQAVGSNTIVVCEISSGHIMFGMARGIMQPKLEEGLRKLASVISV
jgi:uncharacterized protein YndB with AHSA1/START domain